jgi:hypothetical protein
MNLDLLFFKRFQHTNVRNAFGSAASQSQTDAGVKGVEFHQREPSGVARIRTAQV